MLPSEINTLGDYLALNAAKAVGMLRMINRMTDETIINRNEIVVFHKPPISLTPLAHGNLLAKGWGIPNAYIKDADQLFEPLKGRFVYFETSEDGYTLRPAETNETLEAGRRLAKRSDLLTPEADIEFRQLTELKDQRKRDAKRFGAKCGDMLFLRFGAVLAFDLGRLVFFFVLDQLKLWRNVHFPAFFV